MLVFVAAACGCSLSGSTLEIIVTDPAGMLIVGAEVFPIAPSISGPPKLTDASGVALIQRHMVQDVQWVSVKARGFETTQVALPHEHSLTITLSPASEEGRSAEETFRKIEETIEKAKTLSIKFGRERETSHFSRKPLGVFLQSGKRAWYSEDVLSATETWCVSDGTRVQCTRPHLYDEGILGRFKAYERGSASESLERNLKIMLSRAGFTMGLASIALEPGQDLDFSKELAVSGFRFGEKNGMTNTLLYTLRAGKDSRPTEVTLWYDPKSLKLLKRKTADRLKDGRAITYIESYAEFTLDADIPDEKFKLPEK